MDKNDKTYRFLKEVAVPSYKNPQLKERLKGILYKKLEERQQKSFFLRFPVIAFSAAALVLVLIIIIPLLIWLNPALPQEGGFTTRRIAAVSLPRENQAIVSLSSGRGTILRADSQIVLEAGVLLKQGDKIELGESFCEFTIMDKAVVRLQANTSIIIESLEVNRLGMDIRLYLTRGLLIARLEKLNTENFSIRTDQAMVDVTGTLFLINVDKSAGTILAVRKGSLAVNLSDSKKKITINKGRELLVGDNLANISKNNDSILEQWQDVDIIKKDDIQPVKLVFITEPDAAEVIINGKYRGTSRLSLLVQYNEECDLLIRKKGYEDISFLINAQDNIEYRIKLKPGADINRWIAPEDQEIDASHESGKEVKGEQEQIPEQEKSGQELTTSQPPETVKGEIVIEKEAIIEKQEKDKITEDIIPPQILNSQPVDGAKNVMRKSNILIRFDEPMADGKSILVRGMEMGPVSSHWLDVYTLEITFSQIFNPNTTYSIILNPRGYDFNIMDKAGNILMPDTTITFRTGLEK